MHQANITVRQKNQTNFATVLKLIRIRNPFSTSHKEPAPYISERALALL